MNTQALTQIETNTFKSVVKPSALNAMAQRLNMDPNALLNTLKNTVFKGSTNEQLGALVVVANEHGLNPFTREIYAFPDKSGGIQAVIGVDGWLRIINSNDRFDGVEFTQTDTECTAILYVKGRAHPIKVTEYLSECKRNTEPWQKYPKRMLRHKALIQAARIAFGFGGLRDEDDVQLHPASATVTVLAPESLTRGTEEPAATEPESAGTEVEPQAAEPVAAEPPKRGRTATAQTELEKLVTESGFTFDEFQKWATGSGVAPEADSWGEWSEVPEAICKRLLRAKVGLLQGLNAGKAQS